jgi:hypothetical protein
VHKDTVQSIVDNTGRTAENDTTKRLKAVIYSQLPHTYPHTFNYPHLLKDFRKDALNTLEKDTTLMAEVFYAEDKDITSMADFSYSNKNFNTQESVLIINDSLLFNGSLAYDFVLNRKVINGQPPLLSKIDNTGLLVDTIFYKDLFHIRTHDNYVPKIISLNDLKKKYTNVKDKTSLFIIDYNIVITDDYDNFVVDENNLFKIWVSMFVNAKENIDMAIIKILTKSEENIKSENDMLELNRIMKALASGNMDELIKIRNEKK